MFHSPLLNGMSVVFATNGPRDQISKMLEFTALFGLKLVVEKLPQTNEGVDASLKKLRGGKMRIVKC